MTDAHRVLFEVTKYGSRRPDYGVTFLLCEHSLGMFPLRRDALEAGYAHVATYGKDHE
jgi:hypothetical protein